MTERSMLMKRKEMKLMLLIAMIFAICITVKPMMCYAEETTHYEGDFGDGFHWSYDDGTLEITGQGVMPEYATGGVQPWGPWNIPNVEVLPIEKVVIGEGITCIGAYTFADYGGGPILKTVILPNSLVSIDHHAFAGCENARFYAGSEGSGQILPDNLQIIGGYAFQGCEQLTRLEFPEGLKEIYGYAFNKCKDLSYVKLPSTLELLSEDAFSNTSLTHIAPAGKYSSNVIEIPWGEGKEIPSKNVSFSNNNIQDVIFPDGITILPKEICQFMSNLTNVTVPDSIKTVENFVFRNCSALKEIDWSDKTNLQVIKVSGVFSGCKALEKVLLPDQVQLEYDETSEGMFAECSALTELHIPDTCENIPDNLLYGCRSLTEEGFNWPSSIKKIEAGAISSTGIKNLDIPQTVTSIGDAAFADCKNLSKVHIPANVVNLRPGIFRDCNALLSAGPSGTSMKYNITYDWTDEIPKNAFNSSMIKLVDIADGITKIGISAFDDCDNLEVAMLSESVRTISTNAFHDCNSLKTVRLPKTIECIEDEAFAYSSLKNLLFRGDAPEVDQFDTGAFFKCKITCYYPKGNPTWTSKIIKREYAGQVTWKPYGGQAPVFADRERTATLNRGGTIKARFYLVDGEGNVLPEARFKFRRRSLGKVEEFENEFLVTDFDGGYDFSAPYISRSDGNVDVEYFDFEILTKEDKAIEDNISFMIHGSATDYVYKETWSAGLGINGKAKLPNVSAASVKLSHSDSIKVTLKHKDGGKQDLTLSITLSNAVIGALSDKIDLTGSQKLFDIEAVSPSESAKIENTQTFKRTIKDYSPDNSSHQQQVTCFLALALLCDKTSFAMAKISNYAGETIDPFFTTTAAKVINNMVDITFDQSGMATKIKVSTSGAGITLSSKGSDFSNDMKLGTVEGETAYTFSADVDESDSDNTEKTYSSGLKSEDFYALFSGSMMQLLGVKGALGGTEVNDTSVSYTVSENKPEENSVSISHCEYDSGMKEAVGWDDILQYHTFTAEGETATKLIEKNDSLKNLKDNKCLVVKPDTYSKIAKTFQESPEPVHGRIRRASRGPTGCP